MWVGLIRPDGYDCVQIDGQLSEYQKLVGGYLETVPTKLHGLLLLLDEEGKLKDKTPNIPATMLAGLIGYDVIVGDAVLVRLNAVGDDWTGWEARDSCRMAVVEAFLAGTR